MVFGPKRGHFGDKKAREEENGGEERERVATRGNWTVALREKEGGGFRLKWEATGGCC